MNPTQHLLKQLGILHPIIQAPMVGVSTPALAAAVSNAGALGSIGLGACTPPQAQAMIHATRALTTNPFNVNLFCHRPPVADAVREQAWLNHLAPFFAAFNTLPPAGLGTGYDTFVGNQPMLDVLLHERPAVISFHFGLPSIEWIHRLREAGIVILACATTPEEAHTIEAAGVDAVIAQGFEAGGHRGVFDPQQDRQLGTFALVQLIAVRSRLPIIAAGGIMNGQGIAAALRLGAAAVQMGTAFILCPESAASAAYRAALTGQRAHRTAVTAAISGRPARGMVNRFFTGVDVPGCPPLPDYPLPYDAAKALVAAASAQGNTDFAVQWAGQGAPLARPLPAADLVATLVREWQQECALE